MFPQKMKERFINDKFIKVYAHLRERIMPKKKDEFECLLSMSDLGKYVGKWIAIVDETVVSTSDIGKEAFEEAKRKCPGSKPLLLKVPSNSVMLL